ncbi:oxidoreductase [Plantactinospora siamensis]|uniref:Oxidoreductase n=1 Tax=Plantactinospora siamensis TaxID=555372 RepID=A0ABV6P561_9ACTN
MTTVLITGTSSGIGRAAAARLARRRDLTVYATARKLTAIADLADAGARTLPLDVTDEASMAAAVAEIESRHGQVDVLVNNAGYGEYGPIEEADLDRVRAQFETNVFGPARLTQLVLPGMRRAGHGRIVNISSMGGRLVFPGGGYYHASKYAVEAVSDALRQEVRPFGIDVTIVEPGLIRTGFEAIAGESLGTRPDGPYRDMVATVDAAMRKSYANRLLAAPPESVAAVIERAVTTPRPRTRYVVTAAAKAMVHTRRLLGGRAFDAVNRLQFR